MERIYLIKKRILIMMVLIIIIISSNSFAEIVSVQEMDNVAQNWLTQQTYNKSFWGGSSSPTIDSFWELKSGDTLLARVYNIDPSGFIVVPALKEMVPVKLYSDKSNLYNEENNGGVALLKDMLSSRIRQYAHAFGSLDVPQPKDGEALFGRGQKAMWDELAIPADEFAKNLDANFDKAAEEAGPLLVSSWHQREPYNNYCPTGDGGVTVVGCVATAAAQIMYYWQWPQFGIGNYAYDWDGDNSCGAYVPGMELSADFSDEYDWANMVDSCDEGCSPEIEAALAELNYEVAVAFDMDFGYCGSSSFGSLGLKAYPTFFKYSDDIEKVDRVNYDISEWYSIIQQEVDNSRPVHYRIHSHNIVCDGYRQSVPGQYEYHMNYGWGNGFNAWFVFDSLYCYWVPPDSLCPAEVEYMLVNIHPQTDPILDYVGMTISDDTGGFFNGVANAGETIQINIDIINKGAEAINAYGTLSTDNEYITVNTSTAGYESNLDWGEGGQTQSPFELVIDPSCPDGEIVLFEIESVCDGGFQFLDTFLLFVGETAGLSNDFEGDPGFWAHRNITDHYLDSWHIDGYRSNSGDYSWKAGGIGAEQYATLNDAGLITPPFLLPQNAGLTFSHWISTEESWDGAIVMISFGDGIWEQIYPVDGYPYTIVENTQNPLPGGTPCYSGYQDWTQAEFDLSSYTGVVQVMFRFISDGAVNDEGWYIDDVSVEAQYMCGDANDDLIINILDVTYLISFLYKGGLDPISVWAADPTGDGTINILDVTYLISHLYKQGPEPNCQ